MLSDMGRRRMIAEFFTGSERLGRQSSQLGTLRKAPPFVRQAIGGLVTRRMKKTHFGQVVPLEDVKEIFGFVNSIVRVPCVCRQVTLGRDVGYCCGCGVCRSVCPNEAISLRERAGVPATADLW